MVAYDSFQVFSENINGIFPSNVPYYTHILHFVFLSHLIMTVFRELLHLFSFLNLQLLSVPLCGCPIIYFTGLLPMDTGVVYSHLLLQLILCISLGHKGQIYG